MLIFYIATDDSFYLILRFRQVCSTNLSWCAKEGWILWLFSTEQLSYDVTWTPTLSWFVFLWHLVKPSRPCARLPRDLQLNKVQRFSVLKAVVFRCGSEADGSLFRRTLLAVVRTLYITSQKQSRVNTRNMTAITVSSNWTFEIAFPTEIWLIKRKCTSIR